MSEVILPAPNPAGVVFHVPPSDRPVRVNGWIISPGESAHFCAVCDVSGYRYWRRFWPLDQPPVEVKEYERD